MKEKVVRKMRVVRYENTSLKQMIEESLKNGWKIKNETEDYVELERHNDTILGHIILFIISFWWSYGLINLIYHWEKTEVKRIYKYIEEAEEIQ